MIYREASIDDWENLLIFYKKIYRENHPLHSKDFWVWQYGDKKHGRSFIMIDPKVNKIVGHLGANFKNDISWMINGYLEEKYRGKNLMKNLYTLAREYYPLAATAANKLGLGMYRNMGWIRYYDLIRYVKINPKIKEQTIENVCRPIELNCDNLNFKEGHYFKQPGLVGIKIEKSTGVAQSDVGGLRLVELNELKLTEKKAWELGFLWIDYITSWNDLKIKELEKNNWNLDFESVIPWRLNPLEEHFFCNVTFLSEFPLDKNIIVNRTYSDHGRVGSI